MIHHSGTVTLDTERLTLRRFELTDAEMMYKNWVTDKEVTKFLMWQPHGSIDETREILERWIKDYDELSTYHWAITQRESGDVIGSIGVVEQSDHGEKCEIGYCLSRALWGKGYMTEALKEVIRYLFENPGFYRVSAHHNVDNPASGRVMEKAGMKKDGILRGDSIRDGIHYDTCVWSILRSEHK